MMRVIWNKQFFKFGLKDVIEVLCRESFSSLTSVNLGCLEETNINDLKEKGKTIQKKS